MGLGAFVLGGNKNTARSRQKQNNGQGEQDSHVEAMICTRPVSAKMVYQPACIWQNGQKQQDITRARRANVDVSSRKCTSYMARIRALTSVNQSNHWRQQVCEAEPACNAILEGSACAFIQPQTHTAAVGWVAWAGLTAHKATH